jgi:hypothetical protein
MSVFDLDPKNSALVDAKPQGNTAVIGLVAEREFALAQAEIADLARYIHYDDWLDSREGMQIGLSAAGVDAAMVRVSLRSFVEWRDLTGASSDQPALDAFAALALTVRNSRALNVLAVVGEDDFAARSLEVAAFGGRGDYQGWARHRRALRAKAIAAGLRVEELRIRVGSFLEWCACLGQNASEAALDRYAQLLLEYLTTDLAG